MDPDLTSYEKSVLYEIYKSGIIIADMGDHSDKSAALARLNTFHFLNFRRIYDSSGNWVSDEISLNSPGIAFAEKQLKSDYYELERQHDRLSKKYMDFASIIISVLALIIAVVSLVFQFRAQHPVQPPQWDRISDAARMMMLIP